MGLTPVACSTYLFPKIMGIATVSDYGAEIPLKYAGKYVKIASWSFVRLHILKNLNLLKSFSRIFLYLGPKSFLSRVQSVK